MNIVHNTDFSDEDLYVIEIGHSKTNPGIKKGPWIRDSYIMHYLSEGRGFFCGQPVEKGQGFLICPNQLHELYSDNENPWEHYWIMFNGLKASGYLSSMNIEAKNQVFNCAWSNKAIKILHEFLYNDDNDTYFALYLLGIFYKVFSFHNKNNIQTDLKHKNAKEKYVKKASVFIRQNYHNNITIEDIAAHVRVSSKYLCKIFNKYAGCSPQAYLIKTRLNRAEELMQYNDLSIREIACSVGYDNALIFSQIYKKYRNRTPSEYRHSLIKSK